MLRSTHKHLANVDILHRPLPPSVNAHIGGPCEPGVQDVDASQAVRPPDGLPQGRVVVQPQSLPEPVDGVDHHVTRLLEVRKRGGGVQIKKPNNNKDVLLCCSVVVVVVVIVVACPVAVC